MKTAKGHNRSSERKWADWQVPPVICVYCGERVLMRHSFQGDHEKGTWHVECNPVRVRVVVELEEGA